MDHAMDIDQMTPLERAHARHVTLGDLRYLARRYMALVKMDHPNATEAECLWAPIFMVNHAAASNDDAIWDSYRADSDAIQRRREGGEE